MAYATWLYKQSVFRSVVITRLLYACSAWWGYASSSDRQRIAAFIRRGVRQGFCSPDLPCVEGYVLNCNEPNFLFYLIYLRHHLYELHPMYSCVLTAFYY